MDRNTIVIDVDPDCGLINRLYVPLFSQGAPIGVYIVNNGAPVDCSNYSPIMHVKTSLGEYLTIRPNVDSKEQNLICWTTSKYEVRVEGENEVSLFFSNSPIVHDVYFFECVQSLPDNQEQEGES